MKHSVLIISLLMYLGFTSPVLCANDSPIRWESYSEALKTAEKDHKLIFVDIYADWCVPCRIMESNAFADKNAAKILNTRFHPVKLNVDSKDSILCDHKKNTPERCFFDVWELNGVPSFVVIAPSGLTVLTLTQTLEADDLRLLLFQFLEKEKEWISK